METRKFNDQMGKQVDDSGRVIGLASQTGGDNVPV